MASPHSWDDLVWDDPLGGRIILHGTLPTVVFPQSMRPRMSWDGLAITDTPDVVDLWEQEEKDERESQGANLAYSLISGGFFSRYLEGLVTLDDILVGRFPDPEPRRLQRNAVAHDRPVYFVEPLADDEHWGDYLSREAKAVSHWRKLLGMIRSKKRWNASVKQHLFNVVKPPKGHSPNYATASVLAAAWWDCTAWLSTPQLCQERDARLAARLRGALQALRKHHGDNATLLVVCYMPHRPALLQQLNLQPEVEEISSMVSVHSSMGEDE